MGHLLSAAYVWSTAQHFDASIALRIEDHDRSRSQKRFEYAIYDDLKSFGFMWDEGPISNDDGIAGEVPSAYRQSNRLGRYQEIAEALLTSGHAYYCQCSRKTIAHMTRAQDDSGDVPIATQDPLSGDELHYPGNCRDKNIVFQKGTTGMRVRMPDQTIVFNDLILGMQQQNPAQQCGDILIRDRHGNWTYQFAVVVDDLDQKIDMIIRGQDILRSTGRQLALREIITQVLLTSHPQSFASAPKVSNLMFFHHPLLVDETGKKLSKRYFSTSARDLLAQGQRPGELLAEVLSQAGLEDVPKEVLVNDLEKIIYRNKNS